jgi:hypothetical protein
MLGLTQLLNALKTATSELKELKIVWWLVGASLVAAIALKLFGSGHAAVVAVGVTLVGVVFSFIVSALANSAAAGNAALVLPSQILVWAVLIFFIVFLLFTIAAVLWCQPVAWANVLNLKCADEPRPKSQGVHISRHSNMKNVGCIQGQRSYVEVIEDKLTFNAPVEKYTITAEKDDVASHAVSIAYRVGNGPTKELGLLQDWQSRWNHVSRLEKEVKVGGGTELTVFYRWKQHPKPNDDSFGLAFVSNLPILSIEATVDLPAGKEVSGLSTENPEHKRLNDQMSAARCTFSGGKTPTLSCPAQVTDKADAMRILAWKWNVFDGC